MASPLMNHLDKMSKLMTKAAKIIENSRPKCPMIGSPCNCNGECMGRKDVVMKDPHVLNSGNGFTFAKDVVVIPGEGARIVFSPGELYAENPPLTQQTPQTPRRP